MTVVATLTFGHREPIAGQAIARSVPIEKVGRSRTTTVVIGPAHAYQVAVSLIRDLAPETYLETLLVSKDDASLPPHSIITQTLLSPVSTRERS
jgi:hypothetical protein